MGARAASHRAASRRGSPRAEPRLTLALTFGHDAISSEVSRGGNLVLISRGEFGPRVGIPRILALLERQGIPATFFVPGHTVATFPDSVRATVAAGPELACHGSTTSISTAPHRRSAEVASSPQRRVRRHMLATTCHRSNRTVGLAPVVLHTAGVVLALLVVLAGCGSSPASSSPIASGAGTSAAGTGSGGSAGSTDGGGESTLPTPSPGNPVGPGYIDDSSATRLGPALQVELDRLRTSGRLPGLSAAIVFADGSEWQGVSGLAEVATRQPLTTDTLFSVGSITKTFVAALVLRLDGEGRLGLDDPISRWLPTFPNASRITVRELLEHRSGVADFFENTACVDRIVAAPRVPWTTQAVLACVGRPYFAPGAGFHYSNAGYVLLGRIVEAVTGVSLAANLQAAFVGPFALDRVALQGAGSGGAPVPPLAHGYLAPARAGGQPVDVTGGDPLLPYTSLATAAGAAGALAATPTDLARWAMSLYSGAVLDRGTVEEMVQTIPTSPDPRGGYGLAVESFSFDGLRAWGHRGHLAGYDAQMAYLPGDGLSIAVATNADWASPDSLTGALLAVALPRAEPARRSGQGGLSRE